MKNILGERKHFAIADAGAEAMLRAELSRLSGEIASLPEAGEIDAVVLGGGYGRGAGGLQKDVPDRIGLCNDLDFFVFTNTVDPATLHTINTKLEAIAAASRARLAVDVDFAPARKLKKESEFVRSLMFWELLAGHEVIFGSEAVFAPFAAPDFGSVPMAEAERLLLNRGTGLLLAWKRRQSKQTPDAADLEYIARNIHKAVLGALDARLIVEHRYCFQIEDRAALLREEGCEGAVRYAEAVAYKFMPRQYELAELDSMHAEAAGLLLRNTEYFFAKRQRDRILLRDRMKIFIFHLIYGLFFWKMGGFRTAAAFFRPPREVLLRELWMHALEKRQGKGYIATQWATSLHAEAYLRLWLRFN
ncbi:MAG: hypothetical protein PHS41_03225 [Victivallaceae bacterium]|nr:hypothetical protein [Victivallaceae bacterium]